MCLALDGLPSSLKKINETKLSISIANGATFWFKSAEKPDNLYGDDVYAIVLDEASRAREEAFFALRSTLTKTRGRIRMIGNVKGRKNWFYQLCRKAEAGEPNHRFTRITAADAVNAGIIAPEEVEDARRTLPEAVFNELFNAEASDDTGNPFGLGAIRARIVLMSVAAPVAFGVDLAKSHDWTVIIGLDSDGNVCRFERFQLPWQECITRIRSVVGHVTCLVDSTGVGDPVLESLQRIGPGQSMSNYEGYKFTSESKQKLMEGLAVAIQQSAVGYPKGPIVSELESYEYDYTRTGVRYSAPEGMHDDAVCALALAVAAKTQNVGRPRWRPI